MDQYLWKFKKVIEEKEQGFNNMLFEPQTCAVSLLITGVTKQSVKRHEKQSP